jgi:hypothetical protein
MYISIVKIPFTATDRNVAFEMPPTRIEVTVGLFIATVIAFLTVLLFVVFP